MSPAQGAGRTDLGPKPQLDPGDQGSGPGPTPLLDAVRALTAAARQSGDFGAFVAAAVAGAAANVGGTEVVLFGRAGSWEADFVRQLLQGTVGHDDEHLWEHATEPLIVDVWLDSILSDFGVWRAYEQADQELQARADAVGGPVSRSWEEPARPWTDEEEAAWLLVQDDLDQLEVQRTADWAAYGDALAAAIHAEARDRGVVVPVEVEVHLEWPDPDVEQPWNPLTADLRERATRSTPLPGGSRSPLERLADGVSASERSTSPVPTRTDQGT